MSSWPLVIVPIYNAVAATTVCLAALQRNLPADAEVLLIDDCSTESAIAPLLQTYAQLEAWQVQHNPENLGFVKTANIGLRQAPEHAVLLNSDTIVTSGWLERMSAAIDESIATITPWSNNGEIVSLPEFCQANPVPLDPDAVALTIAATGKPEYPELPTAVGFCMLITARAICKVGYFDEQTFGLGYGEENDYSRRAVAIGLRNILCDDAFVCHLGNQSFGPRGIGADDASMQRLLSLHPNYLQIIQEYISDDPLSHRRSTLLTALADGNIKFPGTEYGKLDK